MSKNSIGVLVEGYDNTFTNMRIYRTQIGFQINTECNILRNIHCLYGSSDEAIFESGIGFKDKRGNNWYDFCYSDQFATGFFIESGSSVFHNCFAYWYSNRGFKHVAFCSKGSFNSTVTNFTMGITSKNATKENIILEEIESKDKGTGCFQNLRVKMPEMITSANHEKYLKN